MRAIKLFTVIVLGTVALIVLIGCNQRSQKQKVADASSDVSEAKQDAREAEVETAAQADWLTFKSDSESRIAVNEKIVAEYKAKMTAVDGKLNAKYDKKIEELENKNKDIKKKLVEYKIDGKSSWEQFKNELSGDLDELGTALKNFVVDEKK